MRSSLHGKSTFAVEVTNISNHGFWLLTSEGELFVPFEEFPWFKDQSVKSIFNLEEVAPGHYYWPELDIDLTEEILKHPNRFPLKSKVT